MELIVCATGAELPKWMTKPMVQRAGWCQVEIVVDLLPQASSIQGTHNLSMAAGQSEAHALADSTVAAPLDHHQAASEMGNHIRSWIHCIAAPFPYAASRTEDP